MELCRHSNLFGSRPTTYLLTLEVFTLNSHSHYGPGIFGFFQQQNEKIANGSMKEEGAHYLHLDTLGIVNGLVDVVVQGESSITYPYNNVSTYTIHNSPGSPSALSHPPHVPPRYSSLTPHTHTHTHSLTLNLSLSLRATASKSSTNPCTTSSCATGRAPAAAESSSRHARTPSTRPAAPSSS